MNGVILMNADEFLEFMEMLSEYYKDGDSDE